MSSRLDSRAAPGSVPAVHGDPTGKPRRAPGRSDPAGPVARYEPEPLQLSQPTFAGSCSGVDGASSPIETWRRLETMTAAAMISEARRSR